MLLQFIEVLVVLLNSALCGDMVTEFRDVNLNAVTFPILNWLKIGVQVTLLI